MTESPSAGIVEQELETKNLNTKLTASAYKEIRSGKRANETNEQYLLRIARSISISTGKRSFAGRVA